MVDETDKRNANSSDLDVTDKDIYEAMKDIPGYLDITPQDLKDIYRHAYQHAVERLTRSTKAKDVMTREVISVAPETPLYDVAKTMAKHEISGVPVTESRKVVGIISQKDFLTLLAVDDVRNLMDVLAEYLSGRGCMKSSVQPRTAREIMKSPVATVSEDTPLAAISAMFAAKRINRVPVLDGEGKMIGIVSRDDIVKAYSGGHLGVY